MTNTDILVIGGGPAGFVAALDCRKYYPNSDITLIRKEEKAVVPCGIPYIFHRLDSVDKDLMSDQPFLDNQINVIIGEVKGLDRQAKKIWLENGEEFGYDKLILGLGSHPIQLPVSGIDKAGVWFIKKDYSYLQNLRQAIIEKEKIAIIGGGFIGVELAEEIAQIEGKQVQIIEKLEHCLITNFDLEFAEVAEKKLQDLGVKISTGQSVQEIGGEQEVRFITLENGEQIDADLVIVAVGAVPNTELAISAGIQATEKGGIYVDDYQHTSDPNILAIGDCAQSHDHLTGRPVSVLLASVASTEARIAARNLYKIDLINQNKGVTSAFSTFINGLAFASVGLTEDQAKLAGIEYMIGRFEAPNHHPSSLANTQKITVKLIFNQKTAILLGGELMGPESVGEMINILAVAIQQKTIAFDFNNWYLASHPLLTAAPTIYPLVVAAQNVK
jgi:pyruvate/2-oxoglutarate dehydrogenase complex dihydrolipoamide dehydrogenase (E3) component